MCIDLELFAEEDYASQRMRNPDDGLANSRKRKDLDGMPNPFDVPPTEYSLSPSEKETLRVKMIPADSFTRCAQSRARIAKTKTLRSAPNDEFKLRNVASFGLHCWRVLLWISLSFPASLG